MYMERVDNANYSLATAEALKDECELALVLSHIKEITGNDTPTVIT